MERKGRGGGGEALFVCLSKEKGQAAYQEEEEEESVKDLKRKANSLSRDTRQARCVCIFFPNEASK